MEKICRDCIKAGLTEEELPKGLVIFSDMQFNYASPEETQSGSCMNKIECMWQKAGYSTSPKIVFWNLASSSTFPSSAKTKNVEMLSGFSQHLAHSFLNDDELDTSPEAALRNLLDEGWLNKVRNAFNPLSRKLQDPKTVQQRERTQKILAVLKRSDREKRVREEKARAKEKEDVLKEEEDTAP
jgi:hypothetical protein